MQGIPLALGLSGCFLLQLGQSPPLLLNHLMPCRRGSGFTEGSSLTGGGKTGASQREEAGRKRLSQSSPCPTAAWFP